MTDIKRIETIPAAYATKNGLIVIEATGGKKPYKYSVNGGITWANTKEFPVEGGTYLVMVRDSNGDTSELKEVEVKKVLSSLQAQYLNNLFDTFGNESQAAMQTPTDFDENGKPTHFLPPRTVHNWRKDPDFAVFVRELKLDGNDYFRDFLEAKAIAIMNGSIPIYQFVSDPKAELDANGLPIDPTKRIKIQVGETLPDGKMVQFMLERRFKDTYSTRQEITGKDGSGRIIAITVSEEFAPDNEDE